MCSISPHRFRHTLYSGVLPGGDDSEKAAIAMLRMSIRSDMSLREAFAVSWKYERPYGQDLLHPIVPMEFELIACGIRFDVSLLLRDGNIGYC
jgi:hypothetical protein